MPHLRYVVISAALAITCILVACSGDQMNSAPAGEVTSKPELAAPETVWPAGLPIDVVQPWEQVDGSGKVIASINGDSEFYSGFERFDESSSGVSDNGEAAQLESGGVGSGIVAWSMYRLAMGGEQPGVVSADVNLLEMSGGAVSNYYIGLSNYGEGHWDWHGPFLENHVRLSTGAEVSAGADYLSALGNLFVCVVAYDGSKFDVVGVSANPVAAGDTTPPDAPVLDSLTPVADGLLIEWLHAGIADLAGFKVYHAPTFFAESSLPGVNEVDYVEGSNRLQLRGIDSLTHVRVAAIDINGNESTLSDIMSATPLPGDPPGLLLTTDAVSGLIGASMNLTATGAENYDWDLDGDGVYEISGDATGTQAVTPAATGIIRPAVRGTSNGGDSVACGSVSLLIGSNSRPIAQGFADPAFGPAPLAVTLTSLSSDFDGTVVKWAWDFDGDRSYDYVTTDPLLINPPPHIYTNPGVYNAKFRAWDNEDAWDVDTVAIYVEPDPVNAQPIVQGFADPAYGVAPLTVQFTSNQFDNDGTVVEWIWDFTSDGSVEFRYSTAGGAENPAPFIFTTPGLYNAKVRAWDDDGAWNVDTVTVLVEPAPNNGPEVVLVTSETEGDAPLNVNLFAVASDPDGSIVDIEWDFDGNGTFNETGDEEDHRGVAAPGVITFSNPGPPFDATVRVTDDSATTAIDSATITPHGWVVLTVDSGGWVGEACYLNVIEGNPAISYYDNTNSNLKYARSSTSTGTNVADWTDITVDTGGESGYFTCLQVIEDNPAISHYDWASDSIKYSRANTTTGSSAGDWTTVTVAACGTTNYRTSLVVADGNPAISYYHTINDDLMYARSTTTTGMAAGDWSQIVTVDGSADDTGRHASMEIVDGNPAIAYYDETNGDLLYIRSSTASGASAANWSGIVTIDSTGVTGQYTWLTVVDGCPATTYFDDTGDDLEYVRSTTATGTSAADWSQQVTVDATDWVGTFTCLAVVNGKPAVSCYDVTPNNLNFAWATTSTGGAGADWPATTTVDAAGDPGRFSCIADIGGHPAIAYQKSTPDHDLKYAYFY